jgi:hypothetical protein
MIIPADWATGQERRPFAFELRSCDYTADDLDQGWLRRRPAPWVGRGDGGNAGGRRRPYLRCLTRRFRPGLQRRLRRSFHPRRAHVLPLFLSQTHSFLLAVLRFPAVHRIGLLPLWLPRRQNPERNWHFTKSFEISHHDRASSASAPHLPDADRPAHATSDGQTRDLLPIGRPSQPPQSAAVGL